MNDNAAIRAIGLTKSFGDIAAVDGLHLEVRRGELFGLVGPDGAGKTTTMRLLASIMTPTSGEAFVAGRSIITEGEGVKERIGYMSQRFGLYEDLTVMENLNFYADLYDVSMTEREERIERLLAFSNLAPFQKRLAGALSGGMKQKLGLACALVHTPEVLLLDEPTNGVDPVSRRDFWRILYDLLKEGVTIFLSTSYLDEAERCTRVGLIHNGRLMITDDPMNIKGSFAQPVIEMWCSSVGAAAQKAGTVAGVGKVTVYGNRLHMVVDDMKIAENVASVLSAAGVEVMDYRRILPSLEDIFISMVEGKTPEKEGAADGR